MLDPKLSLKYFLLISIYSIKANRKCIRSGKINIFNSKLTFVELEY